MKRYLRVAVVLGLAVMVGVILLGRAGADQAERVRASQALALSFKAMDLATQHRFDDALAQLHQAIALNPRADVLAGLYAQQASIYDEMADYGRALAAQTIALQLDHEAGRRYFDLARLQSKYGQYEAAIADLNLALAHGTSEALVCLSRGLDYLALGQTDLALADLNRSLKLREESATYAARGRAYARLGERTQARADLQRALELGLGPEAQSEVEALLAQLTP